jgi:hypothetical protein
MPFSAKVRERAIKRTDCCQCCQRPLLPETQVEVHSATSLHLERVIIEEDNSNNGHGKRAGFLVQSAPQEYEKLEGRILPLSANSLGERAKDDALVFCHTCHKEIGDIALEECRLEFPDFSGQIPAPQILAEVSLELARRGKPLVYEEHEINFSLLRRTKELKDWVLC